MTTLRKPGWAMVDDNGYVVGFKDQVSGVESALARLNADGTALVVNGNDYALLPLDANDNVLVNIGMRQNTLANLLALDGLPGEISVATDAVALVVHNGVAGQAVALDNSFVRAGTNSYRGGLTSDTLAGSVGAQAFDIQASRSASSRYAAGTRSIALGNDIQVSSPSGIAIGENLVDPNAAAIWNILIGRNLTLPSGADQCVSFGSLNDFTGTSFLRCTSVGANNDFTSASSFGTVVGSVNTLSGNGTTVVGYQNSAQVAINSSVAAIVLGHSCIVNAAALGISSVFGSSCSVGASGNTSWSLGNAAVANGDHNGVIAAGDGYTSTTGYAVTIGANKISTSGAAFLRVDAGANQVTLGGKGSKIRVPTASEYTTYAQALVSNQYMNFELVTDTQLRIHVRGTDGVVRHADLTLVP